MFFLNVDYILDKYIKTIILYFKVYEILTQTNNSHKY